MQALKLYDPSGTHRATLPAPVSFHALLGAAWGLGGGDSLALVAVEGDQWELMALRPGREPFCFPLGVRTALFPEEQGPAFLEAMCEVAWHELAEEGWRIEKSLQSGAP